MAFMSIDSLILARPATQARGTTASPHAAFFDKQKQAFNRRRQQELSPTTKARRADVIANATTTGEPGDPAT